MADNYESEILCFAHKDRANWHGAFRTAQGKPTPELWNEYALELCEEYLLQAKKLIKIEMRNEGDIVKKAKVSRSFTIQQSTDDSNEEAVAKRVEIKIIKESNSRLYNLAKALENISIFVRELKANVNLGGTDHSDTSKQHLAGLLPSVDQWDNTLKAMVIHKLYPNKTGYSLAKQYSSILHIKPTTLKRLIQRDYPGSMEPLKETGIDIEEAMNAMRAFLESKNIEIQGHR